MNAPIENEAAVREAIIAPILQQLNYSAGGPNYIRYEVRLVYPHEFLGRKKRRTDPPLVGKADYLCRAGGKVAWTVEAKPPQPITQDDVEQAYSYAKHAEVRAVYFCVCNGMEFSVYDTNADPSVGPILVLSDCRDPRDAARQLAGLLGPEALLARHAVALADTKPAIGTGLWSFAQVVGGQIVHDRDVTLPALRGFTISIVGGAIQRADDSTLVAYFEGRAPYADIQEAIDALGLSRVIVYSDSKQLSSDSASPTVFKAEMAAVFPAGLPMLDLTTHSRIVLPQSLRAEVDFQATGALNGRAFAGRFGMKCVYTVLTPSGSGTSSEILSHGRFEFILR